MKVFVVTCQESGYEEGESDRFKVLGVAATSEKANEIANKCSCEYKEYDHRRLYGKFNGYHETEEVEVQ